LKFTSMNNCLSRLVKKEKAGPFQEPAISMIALSSGLFAASRSEYRKE
jgi:hypothetical protein